MHDSGATSVDVLNQQGDRGPCRQLCKRWANSMCTCNALKAGENRGESRSALAGKRSNPNAVSDNAQWAVQDRSGTGVNS